MRKTPKIVTARAYDLPLDVPGYRVLVDRLWPRGVTKAKLKLDAWLKDFAPSTELRKWFHADPATRFSEFKKRYLAELREQDPAPLESLREVLRKRPVVLIYGSRDEQHNHAQILGEYLLKKTVSKKKGKRRPVRPRK